MPIDERPARKFALELLKIGAVRLLSEAGSAQRLSVSLPAVIVSLPTRRWTLFSGNEATLLVVLSSVMLSVVPMSWMLFVVSPKPVGLNEMPAEPVASVLLTRKENQTVPLIGASSEHPLWRKALNVPKSLPGVEPVCGRL